MDNPDSVTGGGVSPVPASIPDALTYRLRETDDPEERLEDAAMFKALWDASGGTLAVTKSQDADFGAVGSRFHHTSSLKYWTDPAFLSNCGRKFVACPFEQVEAEVSYLHSRGMDAFVKSALDKYFIATIRRGEKIHEAIGDMAYSFIDSPVPLMVQELVDFTFEHRFFVVDGHVVTWSSAGYTLTPLDFPRGGGWAWRKQADKGPSPFADFDKMLHLAAKVAVQMREPTAVIDIGMIGDKPAVVEFNPLRAGQIGLFACDIRKLAQALYAKAIASRAAPTSPQPIPAEGGVKP